MPWFFRKLCLIFAAMKHLSLLVFSLALLAAAQSCATSRKQSARPETPVVRTPDDGLYAPYTLIIYYEEPGGHASLTKAVRKYKAEIIYDYKNFNAMAIRIPTGTDIHAAIDYFQKTDGVLSVSRDRIMHLH